MTLNLSYDSMLSFRDRYISGMWNYSLVCRFQQIQIHRHHLGCVKRCRGYRRYHVSSDVSGKHHLYSLVWYAGRRFLWQLRRKTGYVATDDMVDRIIRRGILSAKGLWHDSHCLLVTVQTGMVTSVCATLGLFTFLIHVSVHLVNSSLFDKN